MGSVVARPLSSPNCIHAGNCKQCGLYVDPGAIAADADKIVILKLEAKKTGVTFQEKVPISDEPVEKFALSSLSQKGP
jgi:hypothetical protein